MQPFATAVASLSAAFLVTFAVEDDTKPSGAAVVPILAVIFGLSFLYAVFASETFKRLRTKRRDAAPPPKQGAGTIRLRQHPTVERAAGYSDVGFTTEGSKDRLVKGTPDRTLRVAHFVAPVDKTVRADEWPKTVRRRGRRLLRVKSFVPGGMYVDEYRSGVTVRVELFYEADRDEPEGPSPPPPVTVPPEAMQPLPPPPERLALADEVAKRADALHGLCEQWRGPIAEGDHWPGAPEDPAERKTVARINMMREYHEHHRFKTAAIFERLIAQTLATPDDLANVKRPEDVNMVAKIADMLELSAERLRVRNGDLADWLGEQMQEVRRLQRDLQREIAPPNLGIGRHAQIDLIEGAFWQLNDEVARRLQRDARPWVDYWIENPEQFSPGVIRVSAADHQEVVRLMEYAIGQLAHIREQVS